jgi:hypothetical protein
VSVSESGQVVVRADVRAHVHELAELGMCDHAGVAPKAYTMGSHLQPEQNVAKVTQLLRRLEASIYPYALNVDTTVQRVRPRLSLSLAHPSLASPLDAGSAARHPAPDEGEESTAERTWRGDLNGQRRRVSNLPLAVVRACPTLTRFDGAGTPQLWWLVRFSTGGHLSRKHKLRSVRKVFARRDLEALLLSIRPRRIPHLPQRQCEQPKAVRGVTFNLGGAGGKRTANAFRRDKSNPRRKR